MSTFWFHLLTFFGGGIILAPVLFFGIVVLLSRWWEKLPDVSRKVGESDHVLPKKPARESRHPDDLKDSQVGWLRMTKEFEVKGDGNNMVGLMQGINSYIDQSSKRSKNLVYAILKRETLWLYSDERLNECQGVLTVSQFEVAIYPKYLPDNEIFHKELPIRLLKKSSPSENDNVQFFFFVNTPSEKEDWFLALLHASKMKRRGIKSSIGRRNSLDFDDSSISRLINILYSNRHHEETLWLNAFIGRVFLSIYKTPQVKQFFINKILSKTKKVRKPSFLGDIQIRDINIGNSTPTITHPKLVELNKSGEMKVEFFMNYRGKFRVEIESEVNIEIPSFKSYKFGLGMGVTLKELSGKMVLHMKSPPTNRFWLGFCEAPSVSFDLEPNVCGKQLNFPWITRLIEKAIMGVIKDVLVLPNMDDFPFFDSNGAGGIFECAPEFVYEQCEEADLSTTDFNEYHDSPAYNRRRSSSASKEEAYVVETDASSILTTKTHSSSNTNYSNDMSDYDTPKIFVNGDPNRNYFEDKPLPELNLNQFSHSNELLDLPNGSSDSLPRRLPRKSSLTNIFSKANSSDFGTSRSPERSTYRSSGESVTERTSQDIDSRTRDLVSGASSSKTTAKKSRKRGNSKKKNIFGNFFNHNTSKSKIEGSEESSPKFSTNLDNSSISSLVLSTHNIFSKDRNLDTLDSRSI